MQVYDCKCPSCEKTHYLIEPNIEIFTCECGNSFYWKCVVEATKPKTPPNKVSSYHESSMVLYRARYPEKIDARKKVYIELRAGRMKKYPCWICGDEKSEAHHHDYSKPLDIVWLCKEHHKRVDRFMDISVDKAVDYVLLEYGG